MIKLKQILILYCLSMFMGSASFAEQASKAAPSWFSDDVEFSSRAGGRWVTDNSKYKSEQEPWDFYVLEWQAGPANSSMSGHMSAIKDDTPFDDNFWAFSQYWNPATGEAIVQQYGWGSVGIGQLKPADSNEDIDLEMRQVFTSFDGSSSETGHRTKHIDDDTFDIWSFTIDEKGDEVAGRYYRWKRDSELAE